MRPNQEKNEKALHDLKILFWIGAVIAGIVIANNWEAPAFASAREHCLQQVCLYGSMVYIVWSALVWAGAHLAVRKGRELVEGAVLGAFGPLGFIIEVLLPASKPS